MKPKEFLILICVLTPLSFLISCSPGTKAEPEEKKWPAPESATNVKKHGNDWVEFTLGEKTFLYHKGYDSETLVQIH